MKQCLVIVLLLIAAIQGSPAHATTPLDTDETEFEAIAPVPPQDSFDEGEDVFETDDREPNPNASASVWQTLKTNSRVTLAQEYGYGLETNQTVTNRSSLRLELDQPLARSAFLRFDGKMFVFWDDDHRSKARGKNQRVWGNLREAYVQFSSANTAVKVGQQIVVWGESEGAVVTDIISPRDTSEFLFPTLEDSRFGRPMINVEQFFDIGEFQFIVALYAKGDRLPERGSAYFIDLFPSDSFRVLRDDIDVDDMVFAARWWRSIAKADLSVMVADVLSNQPGYEAVGVQDGRILLQERFPRYQMLGAAAGIAFGSYLLKIEGAYKFGRSFADDQFNIVKRDTIDASIGVEYTAQDNTTIAGEVGNQHILEWEPSQVQSPRNDPFVSLSVFRDFLYETLTLQYLSVYQVEDEGFIHTLTARYKLTDDLQLGVELGVIDYEEDTRFGPLRDRDKLWFTIEYSF